MGGQRRFRVQAVGLGLRLPVMAPAPCLTLIRVSEFGTETWLLPMGMCLPRVRPSLRKGACESWIRSVTIPTTARMHLCSHYSGPITTNSSARIIMKLIVVSIELSMNSNTTLYKSSAHN